MSLFLCLFGALLNRATTHDHLWPATTTHNHPQPPATSDIFATTTHNQP